jgi:hypothetical protein
MTIISASMILPLSTPSAAAFGDKRDERPAELLPLYLTQGFDWTIRARVCCLRAAC